MSRIFGIETSIYFFLEYFKLYKNSYSRKTNSVYSLKHIAQNHNIKYLTTNDVNSQYLKNILLRNDIDLIINDAGQIYNKNTLEFFKYKILNKHSSYLPAYKGVYPIFWQMLNNDNEGGVTLHWIDESLDGGKIAYQEKLEIDRNLTMIENYKNAFDLSFKLIKNAITDLKNQEIKYMEPTAKPSYYSFPRKNDVKKFKKRGCKIV